MCFHEYASVSRILRVRFGIVYCTHVVGLLDEFLGVDDVTVRVGVLDQGPAVVLSGQVHRLRVTHLFILFSRE